MKKMLIICPTRERGHKIEEFYKNFKENSLIADLVLSLDDDDDFNYPRFNDGSTFYEVGFRNEIVPAINYVAYKYAQKYEYIGMLNDDHMIRTQGWDQIIYDQIKDMPISISYPNDLYPSSANNYASCVIMDSKIIKCLGYMANPMLKHFYPDTIWIEMGNALNCLRYFPDVVVEHMHYTLNKSEKDALNEHVGDWPSPASQTSLDNIDRKMYYMYNELFASSDVLRVQKYLELKGKE